MKKVLSMLLAAVMLLSLAACGGNTSSVASGTQAESSEPEAVVNREVVEYYFGKSNEVVVDEDSVTFTDASGRESVTVMKNPQKVALLYGSYTSLWYEAGGTAYMTVGGTSIPLYEEQIGRDITKDEGVILAANGSSASSWDIEAMIALEPDLIICSTSMKGYATISGPAEAAGIPVVAVTYENVQDYLKWFKVFCNLNDKAELWDEVADKTAQGILDIIAKVPSDVEAPRVVSIAMYDTPKLYTGASMNGAMIYELGAVNVADPDNDATAASFEFSMEDLYAADPDIIFMVETDRTGDSKANMEAKVSEDPVWNSLTAVKNGKVYVLEMGVYLNRPNHRFDEAYKGIAEYLYPDVEF